MGMRRREWGLAHNDMERRGRGMEGKQARRALGRGQGRGRRREGNNSNKEEYNGPRRDSARCGGRRSYLAREEMHRALDKPALNPLLEGMGMGAPEEMHHNPEANKRRNKPNRRRRRHRRCSARLGLGTWFRATGMRGSLGLVRIPLLGLAPPTRLQAQVKVRMRVLMELQEEWEEEGTRVDLDLEGQVEMGCSA